MIIDWHLIGEATKFYTERGYKYVEVPWWCSSQAHRTTCPKEIAVYHASMADEDDAFFIGSAEQSLLGMIIDGRITPGKYVATTPCFRAEASTSALTRRAFMKVELMDYGTTQYEDLLHHALSFMELYCSPGKELKKVNTDTGIDIECDGVELGSYGHRSHRLIPQPWAYGTGLAEPRFSGVMK